MAESAARTELAQNVLVHLYNSAVLGSLRSTAPVLKAKDVSWMKNPRLEQLRALYRLSEDDRRLFFAAARAIAEFAVYRAIDFVERYHRFDSDQNKGPYPHLSLIYTSAGPDGLQSTTLSEHGSEELGRLFKKVALSDEMKALAEAIIDQLVANAENRGQRLPPRSEQKDAAP
jgi:hypothetical protein